MSESLGFDISEVMSKMMSGSAVPPANMQRYAAHAARRRRAMIDAMPDSLSGVFSKTLEPPRVDLRRALSPPPATDRSDEFDGDDAETHPHALMRRDRPFSAFVRSQAREGAERFLDERSGAANARELIIARTAISRSSKWRSYEPAHRAHRNRMSSIDRMDATIQKFNPFYSDGHMNLFMERHTGRGRTYAHEVPRTLKGRMDVLGAKVAPFHRSNIELTGLMDHSEEIAAKEEAERRAKEAASLLVRANFPDKPAAEAVISDDGRAGVDLTLENYMAEDSAATALQRNLAMSQKSKGSVKKLVLRQMTMDDLTLAQTLHVLVNETAPEVAKAEHHKKDAGATRSKGAPTPSGSKGKGGAKSSAPSRVGTPSGSARSHAKTTDNSGGGGGDSGGGMASALVSVSGPRGDGVARRRRSKADGHYQRRASIVARRGSMTTVLDQGGAANDIRSLDLSENVLGPAASQELASWLPMAPNLTGLSLIQCSMMDGQADVVAEALSHASKIVTLDLSHNRIECGAVRRRRRGVVTVDPVTGKSSSTPSGPLAAAQSHLVSLVQETKALKYLNLAWNRIGEMGGRYLGAALHSNTSLTTLSLSWNALTTSAAIAIGEAVTVHPGLTYLNLAHNKFDGAAALVLGQTIAPDATLRQLDLSGNPIGSAGAREIMRRVFRRGNLSRKSMNFTDMDVGMQDCALHTDDEAMMDPEQPARVYVFDLGDTVSRLKLLQLLEFASFREGYKFGQVSYVHRPRRRSSQSTRATTAASSTRRPGTRGTSATDGAGGSAEDTGTRRSSILGTVSMRLKVQRLPYETSVDVDGDSAAAQRLESTGGVATLVDTSGTPWPVPHAGMLTIHVGHTPPAHLGRWQAVDARGFSNTLHMLEHATPERHQELLLIATLHDVFLSARQLRALWHLPCVEKARPRRRVAHMARMLMRLVDGPRIGVELMKSLLSREELPALEKLVTFGSVFDPSNPTGHFKLNLSLPIEWAVAKQMLEINRKQADARRARGMGIDLGNTSQDGSYNNLRNCTLNGRPWAPEARNLTRVPAAGTLEFDFVSTSLVGVGVPRLGPRQFVQFCLALGLIYHPDAKLADAPTLKKRMTFRMLHPKPPDPDDEDDEDDDGRGGGGGGGGSGSAPSDDKQVAVKVFSKAKKGGVMRQLTIRSKIQAAAKKAQAATVTASTRRTGMRKLSLESQAKVDAIAELLVGGVSKLSAESVSSIGHGKTDEEIKEDDKFSFLDDLVHAARGVGTGPGGADGKGKNGGKGKATNTDSDISKYKRHADYPPPEVFALLSPTEQREYLLEDHERVAKTLKSLRRYANKAALSATQAAAIVDMMPDRVVGSKVEAAVVMHARITDLGSFRVVINNLDRSDQYYLARRIGWLNMVHPINPDYHFDLELNHADNRRLLYMLSRLQQREGPTTWSDVVYNGKVRRRFEAPSAWDTVAGIPSKGKISFTYSSTAPGVVPQWKERIDLGAFTLANDSAQQVYGST